MSDQQRDALREMRDRNAGAVLTRLGWTWACHVRESEEAAQAVLDALKS